MYDSVTAKDIPASAAMVAGYVSGPFRWSDADWARFPNATKVRIATRANVNDGHVLDVEPGAATPAQAPGWVQMRRAAGVDPTVYCSLGAWPAVRAAFAAADVAEPHYWIAHYDYSPALPGGAVAKQYADPAHNSGGHYDKSSVADYWPGIDPIPTPSDVFGPKTNSTQEVEIMQTLTVTPPDITDQSVRVFLSGSPGAAVIIRPRIDEHGNAFQAMWVNHIFAWGSENKGIGYDPGETAGYDPKTVAQRRYPLPGALWADIAYSAAESFTIDVVG